MILDDRPLIPVAAAVGEVKGVMGIRQVLQTLSRLSFSAFRTNQRRITTKQFIFLTRSSVTVITTYKGSARTGVLSLTLYVLEI